MNKKIVLSSITLLIILIIAIFIALLAANNLSHKQQNKTQKNMDSFMTNVVYININNNGKMHDQLAAEKIIHYADEDVYLLQKPHLVMIDKNHKIWDISALQGKSIHNNHIIYLKSKVNISQIDPVTKKTQINVTTSKATIYPNKKTGKTDQPIVIKQDNSVIQAIGANVDFNKATVKLLSKVRGKYKS